MNTPIRDEQFYGPDEQSSDHSKYAPKRPRPQHKHHVATDPTSTRDRWRRTSIKTGEWRPSSPHVLSSFRSHHHYQWRTARWD